MREEQSAGVVAAFNECHPVGVKVVLINDLGKRELTTTRSEAFVDVNFIPAVMVKGRSGYYILERIIPYADGLDVASEANVEGGE